jgi:hypothetical protein
MQLTALEFYAFSGNASNLALSKYVADAIQVIKAAI